MKRNNGKIDFKTVVTKEDIAAMSEEQKEYAIKEGNYHANYLRNQYQFETLVDFLPSRARELAFLGRKYKDVDLTTKEVIASTITYPKIDAFIKILVERGVSYSRLCTYAILISKSKKLALLAEEMDLELDADVQLGNKKLAGICSLFKKYYGFQDYNLILAKINEIAVWHKDLYKKIESDYMPKAPEPKTPTR